MLDSNFKVVVSLGERHLSESILDIEELVSQLLAK